jgi:GNAT superfamily N-acetyltransferase
MFEIRAATVADAALISAYRRAMFIEMGRPQDVNLETMIDHFEPWVMRMINDGKYFGWITENGGRPIASAALLILDWPPHFSDPTGEHRGYLHNVFVEPTYRRRGLARALVERCMVEARLRRIRVVALHCHETLRPLYEDYGFHTSKEMQFVEPPWE